MAEAQTTTKSKSGSSSAAPKAAQLGKQGKVDLPKEVFTEPFHESLVHQAARADLAARRRGTHSSLTRGEVAMTGAKAWRQKGTGRARVGALGVPHRYGGGAAFGPKPRHYTFKVNRKERRAALRSALSVHAERGTIAVLDPSGFDAPSTKQAATLLGGWAGGGSVLVVLADEQAQVALSFRNLARVSVLPATGVGVADLVGASRLLVTEEALASLTARAKGEKGAAPADDGEDA